VLGGDDHQCRVQLTLFLQLRDEAADRLVDEADLCEQQGTRCAGGVQVSSAAYSGLDQFLAHAHRLEVHAEDGRHRGGPASIVSEAIDLVENADHLEHVIAAGKYEAVGISAEVREVRVIRGAATRKRQRHGYGVDLWRVIVVEVLRQVIRTMAVGSRYRSIGRMLVRPRRVAVRRVDDAIHGVGADEVPRIHGGATACRIPRQLVVIDGGYATITAARAHAVEEGLILVDAFLVFGGRAVEDVVGAIAGREPVTSGWLREDGGYVDRVDPFTLATVDANSNRDLTKIVRGALMFAPTGNVKVTPSVLYQSARVHDTSTFFTELSEPRRGVFKNADLLQQPFDDTYYLACLKIMAHWRVADLSATGSYFDRTANAMLDLSPVPPASPAVAAAAYFGLEQQMYTGEVRLTSTDPDASLTWVAGTFASREHAHLSERDPDSITEATVTDQSQLMAFGQIDLKLTRRLTASIGSRVGRSRYESFNELLPFRARASDTWMAPRFGLSWQGDEHGLFYLTVAKGYGSGGVSGLPTAPPHPYPPEGLWSYEVGSKHVLLNGRLHFDAGLFHIHWNNGQPDANSASFEGIVPGTGESNGFDLTAQTRVSEQGRLALGVAYTDARVTQTVTRPGQLFVRDGDSLGGSPWSVTASIEHDFPLRDDVAVSVRVEDVFRSSPGPAFFDNPNSALYIPSVALDPSTNILNIRASVRWSGITLPAILSNALGSQPTYASTFTGPPPGGASSALTLAPRTLSISGTWQF
jgi:TonB dependent receptor